MQIDLNPIQGQISRPSAGRQMQTPYCKEQQWGGPLSLKEKHCIPLINPPHHRSHILPFPPVISRSLLLSPSEHFPATTSRFSSFALVLALAHTNICSTFLSQSLCKRGRYRFHVHNRNIKQEEEEKPGYEIVERRNNGCQMLEVWLPRSHFG